MTTIPTTTLTDSDRDWVRKIVDHIDEVGWCTGTLKNSSGEVCLIGAGVEVTTGDSLDTDVFGCMDIEEGVAERLLIALGFESDTRDKWFRVSQYNDGFTWWEDLKKDVLGRIS